MSTLYFLFLLSVSKSSHSDNLSTPKEHIEEIIGETRRIMRGAQIFDTRPYMVYLRPTLTGNNELDPNWLCGGVIIDERYILTSAACIEDISYFYVVAGTHRWLPPSQSSECIENGALRALWKCIPRSYRYDGHSFNNIRWMVNDIAVVMTEDPFDFTRRVKGCDFVPQKIVYNNISKDLEAPGAIGYIAGWGSTLTYTDVFDDVKAGTNSPYLMEARSIVIQKSNCKRYWARRYHTIIDKYMICGKRGPTLEMRGECGEEHASCRQLLLPEEIGPRYRRFESNPDQLLLHSAADVRRAGKVRRMKTRRVHSAARSYGGFCENDHGGPLLIGQGRDTMVLGIISAYMVKNDSKKCYGPFLYTSVYNNRFLIECALYKEIQGNSCKNVLRDVSAVLEEETFHWGTTPPRTIVYEDGSASHEVFRSGNVTNGANEANNADVGNRTNGAEAKSSS